MMKTTSNINPFGAWHHFTQNCGAIVKECLPTHQHIIEFLSTFEVSEMPNVLLHGHQGFPIDCLWEEAFKIRFNLEQPLKRVPQVYAKYVPYNDCHYLIEIDLHHPDINKDIVHVSNFIKTIIQTKCIHMPRHIFVLKHIEMLYDEFSFRIILERFSQNAIFICTTNHVAIGNPLSSRFLHIRVPLPSVDEIDTIVKRCSATDFRDPDGASSLKSRDLVRALLSCSLPNTDTRSNEYSYPPLSGEFPPNPSIEALRELAYKLCQYNISISDAAQDLICEMRKRKRPGTYIAKFINDASKIDHMFAMSQRGKEPLYMEYLLHAAAYGNIVDMR
jgi:hypothetical protein